LGGKQAVRSRVKHTVSINGREISISLEEAFWSGLKDIAQE